MVIADAPTLYDPKEAEEEYGIEIESDLLAPFRPHLGPETDTASETSQSTAPAADPEGKQGDPGTTVLIENLGPNNTELHFAHRIVSSSRQSVSESSDTAMTDPPEAAEATEGPDISSGAESSVHPNGASSKAELEQQSASTDGVFDAHALKEAATASLLEHEAVSQQQQKGALEKRHDSAQGQVPQLRREKRQPRSGRNSPSLRLQTNRVVPQPEDTIATSPNLSKHVIERGAETLPALHKSPIKEGSTVSPQAEKLPPIRQLVTTTQLEPLEELAQVATQHDPRYAHNHSQSYGSATSQSPVMAYHHYPSTAQTSPSSQHAYSTRSPNSAFSETYGSPTQYSHATAYFADRRSSAPTENHPPPPPSLPSASSSGESHGPASSSADGYSTQHTTPVDLPDGTPRPILPPPAGMPQGAVVITTGYKCDYPGCFAAPFQTQYLLSSHKNVHSQARPHYCPVKECPRSEGGKGFKRKNEMIRHGLVHDSPGYICPFCPDREHRYPRPDNLQRHVRVHHGGKDLDDPQLREVLAQRTTGAGKTRRRRTNTAGSASGEQS